MPFNTDHRHTVIRGDSAGAGLLVRTVIVASYWLTCIKHTDHVLNSSKCKTYFCSFKVVVHNNVIPLK